MHLYLYLPRLHMCAYKRHISGSDASAFPGSPRLSVRRLRASRRAGLHIFPEPTKSPALSALERLSLPRPILFPPRASGISVGNFPASRRRHRLPPLSPHTPAEILFSRASGHSHRRKQASPGGDTLKYRATVPVFQRKWGHEITNSTKITRKTRLNRVNVRM